MWLLMERHHTIRNLMILSSRFEARRASDEVRQAKPKSAKAALWWSAAACAKQQNTTRAMPRGDAAHAAARRIQFRGQRARGDAGGVVRREAIDARGDRRKCNRGQAVRHGQIQRRAIAGCQQLLLTLAAAIPDRTDGVNDVLRRQPMTPRDLGGAGRAAAERAAFDKQFRSCGAMDRAVDATDAEQRLIGGIDDG